MERFHNIDFDPTMTDLKVNIRIYRNVTYSHISRGQKQIVWFEIPILILKVTEKIVG